MYVTQERMPHEGTREECERHSATRPARGFGRRAVEEHERRISLKVLGNQAAQAPERQAAGSERGRLIVMHGAGQVYSGLSPY